VSSVEREAPRPDAPRGVVLKPKEGEVLEWLARNLSNKEIVPCKSARPHQVGAPSLKEGAPRRSEPYSLVCEVVEPATLVTNEARRRASEAHPRRQNMTAKTQPDTVQSASVVVSAAALKTSINVEQLTCTIGAELSNAGEATL